MSTVLAAATLMSAAQFMAWGIGAGLTTHLICDGIGGLWRFFWDCARSV